MTSQIGILEWLQGTCPLKAIIQDEWAADPYSATNRDSDPRRGINLMSGVTAARMRSEWLGKKYGNDYNKCYEKAGREEAVNVFEALSATVPDYLLRRRLLRMCARANPEAFLTLRTQFANSVAVLSVCSYLLGIGDRHLDNFLLDERDGAGAVHDARHTMHGTRRTAHDAHSTAHHTQYCPNRALYIPPPVVVGIDFGLGFGNGTILLPVPELIPFRLTKQLTSALQVDKHTIVDMHHLCCTTHAATTHTATTHAATTYTATTHTATTYTTTYCHHSCCHHLYCHMLPPLYCHILPPLILPHTATTHTATIYTATYCHPLWCSRWTPLGSSVVPWSTPSGLCSGTPTERPFSTPWRSS
jgi:hypothetical protein